MKTDALIRMLANGAVAADTRTLPRRYAVAIGWSAFGAAVVMAIVLGVRPDLFEAAREPMFWVKLAFPAALAVAALVAAARLTRPGVELGRVPAALAAPVAAIWLLAAAALFGAAAGERTELLLGRTWAECLASISFLAVPAFVPLMWAARGLAPTRPALAGAAVGLLAGALAAMVYALHCPEMAAPFIGTWYLAGMLIPAAIGAIAGARLLRW